MENHKVIIDESKFLTVVVCGEWRACAPTRAAAIVALARYLKACGDPLAAHNARRYLRRKKALIEN